jgi:hypothetical protein
VPADGDQAGAQVWTRGPGERGEDGSRGRAEGTAAALVAYSNRARRPSCREPIGDSTERHQLPPTEEIERLSIESGMGKLNRPLSRDQIAPRPVRVRPLIAFHTTTAMTAPMTATTIVDTLMPVR